MSQGKNLILTPGIYHVDTPILVTRPNTIVLGLGLATLVPDNETPAVVVSDVDGVLICSILHNLLSIRLGGNATVAGINHAINGGGDSVTNTPPGVNRGASQLAKATEYP